MRLGLKLIAANGSQAVTVPAGRTLVVGRSPACDVPIRDLTVSRHHGELEAAAAGLRVRDLGSTNGTFINGARISEGVAAPGARVAFGKVVFQVLAERATGGIAESAGEGDSGHLEILEQIRAQSVTELATLLAPESAAAAGRSLRVTGDTPAERRANALAVLLETAKELSQQGEPARLLDKAARLLLQAMRVDRVEILTRGDEDEMTPRVSKVRPGGSAGGRVPRLAARKAGIERVAVLITERAPATGTDSIARVVSFPAPGAPAPDASPADPAAAPDAADSAAAPDAAGSAADPDVAAPAADGGEPAGGETGTGGARRATGSGTGVAAGASTAGSPPATGSGALAAVAGTAAISATPDGEPGPERLGTAICAPLLGMQATAVGLLYVAAGEEALGREDLEFVAAFAGVVAVTLENLSLMERAHHEAVAQAGFQRHFAPFVADQIAGESGGLRLDGLLRKVAFLCCEIRGTAELAEELQPAELTRQLGDFFAEALDVVFEHGGTLDQVTGTGLTAFWGAPLSQKDDADEAVQAAIGMQRGLERLNGEWSRQQRPRLDVAIGIDLGQVFAGSIGSERRLEYTAIGKPVGRAAALCAVGGAGEILVTEALLEAVASPPPVDPVENRTAAAAPPSPPAAAGGAEPAPANRAFRIDWRTPPTLRQSGEVSQEPSDQLP